MNTNNDKEMKYPPKQVTIPCNPPCIPRTMIGTSWHKLHGYPSPCGCAWVVEVNEAMKEATRDMEVTNIYLEEANEKFIKAKKRVEEVQEKYNEIKEYKVVISNGYLKIKTPIKKEGKKKEIIGISL